MAVTVDTLRRFDIFSKLNSDLLGLLAESAVLKSYGRREVVLSAGGQGDAVCFVFEGRLQGVDFTIDGREVGLYFSEPGDYVGVLSLFDGDPQPDYVISLSRSMVIHIPRSELLSVAKSEPDLFAEFGAHIAKRLRAAMKQRGLLGITNINQRVCAQLYMLLQESRLPGVIQNPPTHQELAIMLSTSRETVTRIFQKLQSNTVLKRNGTAEILILDAAALEALATSSD